MSFSKLSRFEAALVAIVAGAMFYQVFVPPIVGMADNGDYWRYLFPAGLRHRATTQEDVAVNWVDTKYTLAPKGSITYISSASLLYFLGLQANTIVSKDGLYDIRVNGAVFAAVAMSGFVWILHGLRRFAGPVRYTISILVAVACVDVGNVAYFNSFYGEPAEFVFFVLFAGAALLTFRIEQPQWRHVGGLFLTGALLVLAKFQTYPLSIVPAFLLLMLIGRFPSRRALVALAGAMLLLVFPLMRESDTYARNCHRWQSVFWTLLRYSPTPDQDMRELGIPPEHRQYIGSVSFAHPNELVDSVVKDLGHEKLALFYLRHPLRFVDTSERVAARWEARPALGNFTKNDGLPAKAQCNAFSLWSSLKQKITPPTLAGLLGLPTLLTIALAVLWARSRNPIYAYASLFPFVALCQFGIVTLGEGVANPDKHLYLYNVAIDGCVIVAAAGAIAAVSGIVQRYRRPVGKGAAFAAAR